MFPEERVTQGEERILRMEEVVVGYLTQSRFILFLHGPIWEFVSEQNYLLHYKNLCLRNYVGKRPSGGGEGEERKKKEKCTIQRIKF